MVVKQDEERSKRQTPKRWISKVFLKVEGRTSKKDSKRWKEIKNDAQKVETLLITR